MESKTLTENFGINVFTDAEMKKRLPEKIYSAYKKTVSENIPLGLDVADEIAKAMMNWAKERGATHYTHWFQPMTGVTAEKHDAFLEPSEKGAIEKFSGKRLVRGESDASSLPNGGLRATFEARGYTAWDPTSYAFVKNGSLYIPTMFCSYGGECLDKKTPLLKSCDAINREALRVLKLFGNTSVKKVSAMVGAEQEYFLVDKSVYEQRLDLTVCGRTLFGAKPPKGQELEDHYFGKIKSRVWDYMADLDKELWALGVYAKTKHNETAPAQHELATVYSTANVATDHNQIVMSAMKTVANRHGMVCLLHEKPFERVNGSGKHNNWSLSTDTGVNLFEPGDKPCDNLQFMLFLSAVVKAVDTYQGLLRISVASHGNDFRLGANEAPPAVISMFLGEELTNVISAFEKGEKYESKPANQMDFGAGLLRLNQDKTDRNRTSPFAFTGNKFEFRMVGSDMSIAGANVVINTIVADVLNEFADKLEQSKNFESDLRSLIKETFIKHERIIFNGNNYSPEWSEEAKKRGLVNYPTTADALPHYTDDEFVALFERQKVFTRAEIVSRQEIRLDKYSKTVEIEAKTMLHIAKREILPAVIGFSKEVAKSVTLKKDLGLTPSCEQDLLKALVNGENTLYEQIQTLEKHLSEVPEKTTCQEVANYHKNVIISDMSALRETADGLEEIVPETRWPFPNYAKVLSSVKY